MAHDRQGDLFWGAGFRADVRRAQSENCPSIVAAELDDAALIGAIEQVGQGDCHGLAAEAARRRLAPAVPALEALCRRFKGFGVFCPLPEQTAALEALAAIGTHEARLAVSRIIADEVVQGPGLITAVNAAARLGVGLSASIVMKLLRHADSHVRADGCRCATQSAEVIGRLLELLHDLVPSVAEAAACALARLGKSEARPALARLLREAPSAEVIEAVAPIADEDCIILLGRIARTEMRLSDLDGEIARHLQREQPDGVHSGHNWSPVERQRVKAVVMESDILQR